MQNKKVNCTIAVDTMGSDKGPTEFIRGLLFAVEELNLDCRFILVGKQRLLERLIKVRPFKKAKTTIEFFDASEVIGMDEKPIQALKRKKDASMPKAVELVREGNADAVVSCGRPNLLCNKQAVEGKGMSGVIVATTIRSISCRSIPADWIAFSAALQAISEVLSPFQT